MNARLKKLPFGSESPFLVVVASTTGSMSRRCETGHIYWPFALSEDLGTGAQNITHLPTGYAVIDRVSKRVALRLMEELRELPTNLEFTRFMSGDKNLTAMGAVVKKFKRYQRKA